MWGPLREKLSRQVREGTPAKIAKEIKKAFNTGNTGESGPIV